MAYPPRLATALFEYFEIIHHRRRRHSALEMRTPIDETLQQVLSVVA
jgi:hypothetical protein